MNLLWKQTDGVMINVSTGTIIAHGYSGHDAGVNNPTLQDKHNIGPIPQGNYTVNSPQNPVGHLGPLAMFLEPDATNQMFGRDAFFIHGDSPSMDRTASNGCIILDRNTRQLIANAVAAGVVRLTVEA